MKILFKLLKISEHLQTPYLQRYSVGRLNFKEEEFKLFLRFICKNQQNRSTLKDVRLMK